MIRGTAFRKSFLRLLLLSSLCALPAMAMVRMAVIIGNNHGLDTETPLQFATRDAQQIDEVLRELDGMDKGYGYLLLNSGVSDVKATLTAVRERVRALRAQNERVQLMIYFSGHGSNEGLHLNGKTLPLADIRSYFKDVEADLKLLVADACFSGALIQAKGAILSDPMPVHYANQLDVNGSAILTSSSAGEFSQESKDLQGSLFTHYFISALRGAADFDHDGRVTLWEAYSQTSARMHHKFVSNTDAVQTPAFDMNIKGSDNVVLTRLDPGEASLVLRGLPQGEYRVLDAVNGVQMAELVLDDARGATLALPRAAYKVYHLAGDQGLEAYADLRKEHRVELVAADMRPIDRRLAMSKGLPALQASEGMAAPAGQGIEASMHSRYYPSFPGREGRALAWTGALHWRRGDWDAALAYGLMPSVRTESWTSVTQQSAQSLACEGRYYWFRAPLGEAFVGPRLEYWWIKENVSQLGVISGEAAGAFAVAGIEKHLFRFLSLELAVDGGAFMKSRPAGGLAFEPVVPVSLSLRVGR